MKGVIMPKEKFNRNAPRVNIGEIAKKHAEGHESRMGIASSAIDLSVSNLEKYNQQKLQNLIEQYGELEGKKRFEIMIQEAQAIFEKIQKLDIETNDETKSSGLRR